MRKKSIKYSTITMGVIFVGVMSFISACGGSGSSSSSIIDNNISEIAESNLSERLESNISEITETNHLYAKAGADQNVTFGQSVLLSAEESYDDVGTLLKYSWSLNSKVVSNQKSFTPTFEKEGTYRYLLTVSNDKNLSATDEVVIKTYADDVVKLATNQGEIYLKMYSSVAPKAVENFETHSKDGYYDGVIFHRVIKDFMIQGGDPTGTGRGGESIWHQPFENEIDPNINFDRPFLLAMANAGGTRTNGSQFFITTKDNAFLNGKYTIFGEVVDGKEVVTAIETTATGRADKPYSDQTINSAGLYFKKSE